MRVRDVDPAYPQRTVCLKAAAAYLEMDPRTLRRRIEAGHLTATVDGRVYRISVARLIAYKRFHTEEGIDAA